MPYIEQKDRKQFEGILLVLSTFKKVEKSGDVLHLLKYVISIYLNRTDRKYANHNELIGVITASYLEVTRRLGVKAKLDFNRKDVVTENVTPLCIEIIGTIKDEGLIKTPGELNYFISCIILEHIKEIENSLAKIQIHKKTAIKNELSYIYSALLFDFYYNETAIYEDQKCKLNGDVL